VLLITPKLIEEARMNYFSALAIVLGITSALISIYEFIKKGSWRPGVAFSVAAVVLLLAAGIVANVPFLSGRYTSGVPSIQNTSTTQVGTGITPTPTQAVPTATLTQQGETPTAQAVTLFLV
jgi:hypothetical protein